MKRYVRDVNGGDHLVDSMIFLLPLMYSVPCIGRSMTITT